jgi:hypothetical protein
MLLIDLRSGYNHFRLHPAMRDYFVVSLKLTAGTLRSILCLVLPFGWSRGGYWFSRLVFRFWTTVKSRFGYRILSYVDDYLICPFHREGVDKDGLPTSLSPSGQAVVAPWANATSEERVMGVMGLKYSSI